jgi:AraC-like DNA-binding protein
MKGDTCDFKRITKLYVTHCFELATPPRVDELARLLRVHPSVLTRSFYSQTGQHLSVVLKRHQLDEAKRLLITTDLPLGEIARRAGFGTINTFFRLFRTHVGCTPGNFRKGHRTGCRDEELH